MDRLIHFRLLKFPILLVAGLISSLLVCGEWAPRTRSFASFSSAPDRETSFVRSRPETITAFFQTDALVPSPCEKSPARNNPKISRKPTDSGSQGLPPITCPSNHR